MYSKTFKIGLICIMLLVCQFKLIAQNSNFTGKWKVMIDSSDFGGLPQKTAAPSMIEVKLTGDSVAVSRTFGEEGAMGETLQFAASQKEVLSPDGNTLRKSKVSWSKDKKYIIFDWLYEVGGNEWHYTRTETWNLSADGKTLTIDRITILPEKTDKVKAVYQKL